MSTSTCFFYTLASVSESTCFLYTLVSVSTASNCFLYTLAICVYVHLFSLYSCDLRLRPLVFFILLRQCLRPLVFFTLESAFAIASLTSVKQPLVCALRLPKEIRSFLYEAVL